MEAERCQFLFKEFRSSQLLFITGWTFRDKNVLLNILQYIFLNAERNTLGTINQFREGESSKETSVNAEVI